MLQLMATMLMLLVPLQQLLAIMHKHSGAGAQATGVRTNVFGSDAAATADYSIAIGNKANASTANSIALGANSTTRSATNVTNATVAGHTYGGFAGTRSLEGSVSVGKAGEERQITT